MPISIPPHFALLPTMALFLDFDGTLAPLGDDPEAIYLTQGQTDTITRCAAGLGGALAMISGRDIRDLSRRVPQTIWRIGNHGLYDAAPNAQIKPPQDALPKALLGQLKQIISPMRGVWCEEKGPVIALHFRAAPQYGPLILAKVRSAVNDFGSFKIQAGNHIVEVKPVAANKGHGLRQMMNHADFVGRMPVMIGDDVTDEDAIITAQELGGIGIKVGADKTQAKYRAANIDAVYDILRSL